MKINDFILDTVKNADVYSMDHFSLAWKQYGNMIRAMANEFPYSPHEEIQKAVRNAISMSNLYPEDPSGAIMLREKLGNYCNLKPENVTLGNGSMEILDMVFRLFLDKGSNVVSSQPDYTAYRVRPKLIGAHVLFVKPNEDFSISADSIIDSINDKTKLIIFSRPHTPTGTILPRRDVIRILNSNFPVLVDEAYIELGDYSDSVTDLIAEHDNLMVARTFSKGFGLAGFRIGYLLAIPEIIGYVNRLKLLENVNLLAQCAASASLDNIEYVRQNIKKVVNTRDWLQNEINKIPGLYTSPSYTNFILIDCSKSPYKSSEIVKGLFERNIFVRDYSRAAGLPSECFFRITIGLPEDMQKIVNALKEIVILES